MWLWWILSIIFLILTVGFAVRTLASSRSLHRVFLLGDRAAVVRSSPKLWNLKHINERGLRQALTSLTLKVRILEEHVQNHNLHLLNLKERIVLREEIPITSTKAEGNANEDNWEELYYEAVEKKGKLEDELDAVKNSFANTHHYAGLAHDDIELTALRSTCENQLNDNMSLQNIIGELQQKLQGAKDREGQLNDQLDAEKNTRHELKHVKHQYSKIQSEADELRERISEIHNRDQLLQNKVKQLIALQSRMEISETEKIILRKSVETIITENELLSARLTELQAKL